MKGGLGSGAMLFLYKATHRDVSLDTVGMKSKKQNFFDYSSKGW